MPIENKYIRNFCIVAHIDHGKSTLADRLLEHTGTVAMREMQAQLLDDMALERQRGITIKARAVAMKYTRDGQEYELNLIDTPGHVDFHYEVSRSLACCEGAILVVDAAQGVEAQTLANAFAAMNGGLHIVAIINRVPPPKGDPDGVLQAMVFDSHYDDYRGAITYVRVMNGTVKRGSKVRLISNNSTHEVGELGQFTPKQTPCDSLQAGQVGYLICNIKSLSMIHIGDTITIPGDKGADQLPGYKAPKRMVYC